MCSNMCARPVFPIGSCTEPASTCVKNENTGASGRSQMMMVSPLASFFTVVRFSNEARSCARANEHKTKQTTIVCIESKRDFIQPPQRNTKNSTLRGGREDCQTRLLRFWYATPLPNSARVLGNHGLSRLASECLLEGSRVLHRAIHAPASRRMRIGQHPLPRFLIGHVLAPDLPIRQEEPLLSRISIDRFHRRISNNGHQRHIRELEAAVIGGIFAQRQFAV